MIYLVPLLPASCSVPRGFSEQRAVSGEPRRLWAGRTWGCGHWHNPTGALLGETHLLGLVLLPGPMLDFLPLWSQEIQLIPAGKRTDPHFSASLS